MEAELIMANSPENYFSLVVTVYPHTFDDDPPVLPPSLGTFV